MANNSQRIAGLANLGLAGSSEWNLCRDGDIVKCSRVTSVSNCDCCIYCIRTHKYQCGRDLYALLRRAQYIKATSVAGQLQLQLARIRFRVGCKKQAEISHGNEPWNDLSQSVAKNDSDKIGFHARVEGLSPDTKDFVGKLQEVGPQSGRINFPNLISFGPKQKSN